MAFELPTFALPAGPLAGLPPELKTIAITMYVLMGLCGSMFAFLFITWWGTRGWLKPLVKAKLRGKSLLLNLTKDKKLKLEAVENVAGMYSGQAGQYMINPESVYHNPAGVPVSIGYEHAGATLNPKHTFFMQKLVSEGIPMEEFVPELDKNGEPKLDDNGQPIGRIKKYNKKIENISELEEIAKDYKKHTGEDLFVTYQGETLRVQDMLNFFLYDINPSLMAAKIENRLAKERAEERQIPWKLFMVMSPLIFTLVIAAIIMINFLNSQTSVQQLRSCNNELANVGGELATCRAKIPVVSGGQSSSTAGGETSLT